MHVVNRAKGENVPAPPGVSPSVHHEAVQRWPSVDLVSCVYMAPVNDTKGLTIGGGLATDIDGLLVPRGDAGAGTRSARRRSSSRG